MSLETYLRAAPKAELHLHLEGAIRPTTVLTLAQRNAVDRPLNDEVALLADPFGLNVSAIDEILLNAVRHSFLPEPAKQRREADYRAQLDALKVVHLLA